MNANENIPFVDLATLHSELEADLVPIFQNVLRTAGFIGGPLVQEFERDFAQYCSTHYCVGVGSGTDALLLALIAAGVKPGDVAVTVPNTFIATAEAISQAGAQPDFVDVDERTFNIDPRKLQQYVETECTVGQSDGHLIHRKTGRPVTAVVPVHLYGQPANMDPILELASRYNLLVIEDACQAHGAEYFSYKESQWKKAGSMGRAAAFSFYPGKNLGACGEAGAVTTNDKRVAEIVRKLRDHGQGQKYYHEMEGYNGRLDAIQAGILQAKLRLLNEWNQKRRENAACYQELFQSVSDRVVVPHEPSWARAVYHLYVIQTANRDDLRKYLDRAGIATGIHYPIPLHLQKAYRHLGYKRGDFPVTEQAASDILSLPMYPQLQHDQQNRVVREVTEFVSKQPAGVSW